MKSKKEACRLCKKAINLLKDNYVILEDYKEGKFFDKGFYHNKCFLDAQNRKSTKTKVLEKMAYNLFGRANRLMNKAEGKDNSKGEEEVILYNPYK